MAGRIDILADRRRWLRQSLVGLLMLPLSVLPFWAYLSGTAEGRLLWSKATLEVSPQQLPELTAAQRAGLAADAPDYRGAAAVLVYHGIGERSTEGGAAIPPETFAGHLAGLEAAGMNPVTVSELAAACADGDGDELPANAVAVTFDDGRAEAMMHADGLLRQAGWRASMFVIAGAADEPGIFYAGWDQLRERVASGRWDLQSHTGELHDLVPGTEGQRPLLVNRLPGEPLQGWRARVAADLDAADRRIAAAAGVDDPVGFAYPFGAWGGDDRSNDDRIAPALRELLADRYAMAFTQDDQDTVPLADCGGDPLNVRRLSVEDWSPQRLVDEIAGMAARSG
jgi:peptidoglycan/xylan/chitin deacetylase (PgdA/CDA1 family)